MNLSNKRDITISQEKRIQEKKRKEKKMKNTKIDISKKNTIYNWNIIKMEINTYVYILIIFECKKMYFVIYRRVWHPFNSTTCIVNCDGPKLPKSKVHNKIKKKYLNYNKLKHSV